MILLAAFIFTVVVGVTAAFLLVATAYLDLLADRRRAFECQERIRQAIDRSQGIS